MITEIVFNTEVTLIINLDKHNAILNLFIIETLKSVVIIVDLENNRDPVHLGVNGQTNQTSK